jgi:hypothetical protein
MTNINQIATEMGNRIMEKLDILSDHMEMSLDELVHDSKNAEAADINNDGLASQIEYLLSIGWTEEEITDRLEELI